MDVSELLSSARDAMTVQRVVGDPYERDGATVIPVARARGGGGGGDDGSGGEDRSHPAGGGGFGLDVTPVGAYVIRGGEVRWEPAIDVNRLALSGMLFATVALLILRSIARTRSRARS